MRLILGGGGAANGVRDSILSLYRGSDSIIIGVADGIGVSSGEGCTVMLLLAGISVSGRPVDAKQSASDPDRPEALALQFAGIAMPSPERTPTGSSSPVGHRGAMPRLEVRR